MLEERVRVWAHGACMVTPAMQPRAEPMLDSYVTQQNVGLGDGPVSFQKDPTTAPIFLDLYSGVKV